MFQPKFYFRTENGGMVNLLQVKKINSYPTAHEGGNANVVFDLGDGDQQSTTMPWIDYYLLVNELSFDVEEIKNVES